MESRDVPYPPSHLIARDLRDVGVDPPGTEPPPPLESPPSGPATGRPEAAQLPKERRDRAS